MVDIAFSFSAASLAASSCLQNLCDLLIIRGALNVIDEYCRLCLAIRRLNHLPLTVRPQWKRIRGLEEGGTKIVVLRTIQITTRLVIEPV